MFCLLAFLCRAERELEIVFERSIVDSARGNLAGNTNQPNTWFSAVRTSSKPKYNVFSKLVVLASRKVLMIEQPRLFYVPKYRYKPLWLQVCTVPVFFVFHTLNFQESNNNCLQALRTHTLSDHTNTLFPPSHNNDINGRKKPTGQTENGRSL